MFNSTAMNKKEAEYLVLKDNKGRDLLHHGAKLPPHTNLTHGLFLYGPWAKPGFYIFKGL